MARTTSPLRLQVSIALVAFAVGASLAWAAARAGADREVRTLALAHELETIGLCANALTLGEPTRHAKLSTLLRDRLDSALAQSSRLADEGVSLGMTAPNLLESPRRAAAYYRSQNDLARQQGAERLTQRLSGEK